MPTNEELGDILATLLAVKETARGHKEAASLLQSIYERMEKAACAAIEEVIRNRNSTYASLGLQTIEMDLDSLIVRFSPFLAAAAGIRRFKEIDV